MKYQQKSTVVSLIVTFVSPVSVLYIRWPSVIALLCALFSYATYLPLNRCEVFLTHYTGRTTVLTAIHRKVEKTLRKGLFRYSGMYVCLAFNPLLNSPIKSFDGLASNEQSTEFAALSVACICLFLSLSLSLPQSSLICATHRHCL